MLCPAQPCQALSQNPPGVERLMLGVDAGVGPFPRSLLLGHFTDQTCALQLHPSSFPLLDVWVAVTDCDHDERVPATTG